MKLNVYTIYDSKAEAYLRPFFAPTKGLAIRSVSDAVNNPQENLHKYAADYTLFEVGIFDDSTGWMEMHKAHVNLGVLHEFLNKADPRDNIDRAPSDKPVLKTDPKPEKISGVKNVQ